MSSRYSSTPEVLCSSTIAVSISSVSPGGEDRMARGVRSRASRAPHSSFLVRLAMRVSRSRWFNFLRRVFHHQNGSRSELGSNPFNSANWMMAECVTLVSQIVITLYTLAVSRDERPVWPMRVWVIGYAFGCVLSLLLLYWRCQMLYVTERDGLTLILSDIEEQRSQAESRSLHCMNKCRASVELFFAIWFVMGNIWVFESRLGSFHRAPKLHVLCIALLAWNAISYSFPFILFVLLCCCVPLLSSLVGYNMNMASIDRGASDEQLCSLPSWRYKEAGKMEPGNSALEDEIPQCCICLAKYKEKEEIRQLPCSHIFHLKCVDQWLRIISCCPLCKQALER